MIIDRSIVTSWIYKDDKFSRHCLKLKETFEDGKIKLRTTDFVKHEVLRELTRRSFPAEATVRLAKLLDEYLNFICEKLDSDLVAQTVKLSLSLKLELGAASCIALSNHFGEVYVTADEKLAKILSSNGFLVQHVSKLF